MREIHVGKGLKRFSECHILNVDGVLQPFFVPVLLNILVAVIKESSHIGREWRSLFKRPTKARFSFINLASSSCYPSIITSGGGWWH
jgi:hypothetical protein